VPTTNRLESKKFRLFLDLANLYVGNGLGKFFKKNTELLEFIRKVRKTQHQNPKFEFGHRGDEIKKKKPAEEYIISIQHGLKLHKTIDFGGILSFILSFHFPQPSILVVN
jgi:hypothetical protein